MLYDTSQLATRRRTTHEQARLLQWLVEQTSLSQVELAQRLGSSASFVSPLVPGERRLTLGMLRQIAHVVARPQVEVVRHAGVLQEPVLVAEDLAPYAIMETEAVAPKAEPSSAHNWDAEGSCLDHLHAYADAALCTETALKREPDCASAWYGRGHSLDSLHRFDGAVDCYDKVLRLDPLSDDAWFQTGADQDVMGPQAGEMVCPDEAVKLDPHCEIA